MKKWIASLTVLLLLLTGVSLNGEAATKNPITKIVIPTPFGKVETAQTKVLKLDVVYQDGTIKRISSGVKWSTANAKVAKVSKGKLVGVLPGNVTLHASYGGKKAKRDVTVRVPSQQSDEAWLTLQRTSLAETGTWLGAVARIGQDIRNVKGTNGAYGFEGTDSGVFGVWQGQYLYSRMWSFTEEPEFDITGIVTYPQAFKRSITKNEWRRVFGAPISGKSYDSQAAWNVKSFYRDTQLLHSFGISREEVFRVGKSSIWVEYDQKGFVHAISL